MRRRGLAAVGLVAASLVGCSRAAKPGPPGDVGEAVYARWCVACHQADGRGMDGRLGADFVGDTTRLAKSDDALLASIRDGVPGTTMIAWRSTLSDDEMRAVLAYVRRFAPSGGAAPSEGVPPSAPASPGGVLPPVGADPSAPASPGAVLPPVGADPSAPTSP